MINRLIEFSLRNRGLVPSPVGKWPVIDDLKLSGAQAWRTRARLEGVRAL